MKYFKNIVKDWFNKGYVSRLCIGATWSPLIVGVIFYLTATEGVFYPSIVERIVPYGIPPILSFLTYFALATLCFQGGRRKLQTLLFGIYCTLFGYLSLDITLASLIAVEEIALQISRIDHFLLVLQSAVGMHFIYLTIGRKRDPFIVLLYSLGFLLMPLTQTNHYFHETMYHYYWGFFAKGSWAFDLYGTLGIFVLAWGSLLLFLAWKKETCPDVKKKFLFICIGTTMTGILTISNIPALNGIEFYPPGNFAFITMLITAYGVFRHDIIKINRYTKMRIRGAFIASVVSAGLALMAIVIFHSLMDYRWEHIIRRIVPYNIPPLLSLLFCSFATILALRVGKNQDASLIFCLISLVYFFLSCDIFLLGIISDPDAALRISRISHTFFVFTPALFIHLLHIVTGTEKRMRLIVAFYILSLFFSIFVQTDYYIQGMYSYYWGFFARKAVLFDLLSAYGFIVVCYAFVRLLKSYTNSENQFQRHQRFYLLLGITSIGIFSLANIPALHGYEIYPMGNFIFIPFMFLTYGMFRNNIRELVELVRSFVYYGGLVSGMAGVYYILKLFMPSFPGDFAGTIAGILLFLIFKSAWKALLDSFFENRSVVIKGLFEKLAAELSRKRSLGEISDTLLSQLVVFFHIRKSALLFFNEKEKHYSGWEFVLPDRETGKHPAEPVPEGVSSSTHELQIPAQHPLLRIFEERRDTVRQDTLEEWILNNDILWVTDDPLRKSDLIQPVFYEDRLTAILLLNAKIDGTVYSNEEQLFIYQLGLALGPYIENATILSELEETVSERTDVLNETLTQMEKITNILLETNKELQSAQSELEKSEKKYRQLLDSEVIGYYEVDIKGTITLCNRGFTDFLGYEPEDLIGKSYTELLDIQNASLALNAFARVFTGDLSVAALELDVINRDRQTVHCEIFVSLIKDEDKIIGFSCVSIDISDKKHTEQALRKSEEKYRTILQNINEGYYEVDIKGNCMFFNNAFCEILGRSFEELRGVNYTSFMTEKSASLIQKQFNRVFSTGTGISFLDWELVLKDGKNQIAEASVDVMRDKNGSITGFYGLIRDITQKKQAEEEIKSARDAAERANQAKSKFLAGMSHELRTPLNAINGIVELLRFGSYEKDEEIKGEIKKIIQTLRKSPAGDVEDMTADIITELESVLAYLEEDGSLKQYFFSKMKMEFSKMKMTPDNVYSALLNIAELIEEEERDIFHSYKRIKDAGDYLLGLIDSILNLAKIESGKLEITRTETNIRELVESVVHNAHSYARAKGKESILTIEYLVDDSVPETVSLDTQKTRQVLLNYISNSIKFTMEGSVRIIVTKHDGAIRFAVNDTGIGIKPEERDRIFHEFGRTDETQTIEGTGLGLTISKKLVELQGGRIGFESEQGKGSSFWFELPL